MGDKLELLDREIDPVFPYRKGKYPCNVWWMKFLVRIELRVILTEQDNGSDLNVMFSTFNTYTWKT